MKQKEIYQSLVEIDGGISLEVDVQKEHISIYKDKKIITLFAFNRKMYTLFKEIQEINHSNDYLTILGNMGDIYSGEIALDQAIYMQVTNEHGCLTLDFYTRNERNEKELLYLMPLTYTVKTMFQNMLIPSRLLEQPNYRLLHVFQFLDMMVILNEQKKIHHKEVQG